MNYINFEEIIDSFRESEKLIVYGVGEAGENFCALCSKYGINVDTYVDTYFKGKFKGVDVCSYDEFDKTMKGLCGDVVICNGKHFEIIKDSVKAVMPNAKIYNGEELFYDWLEDSMDSESFTSYHENNKARIVNVLEKLEDDFSRETFLRWSQYYATKDASVIDGYWSMDQYFPKGIYSSREGCFIDAGCYNGKNIKDIFENNPLLEKVVGFEPLEEMLPTIKSNIDEVGLSDKVDLYIAAVSEVTGTTHFDISGTGSSIGEEGVEVKTIAIDDLGLNNVSFIKMDIEGAELSALHGAKNTILNNAPFLAICVYHKPEDIVEIPEFIMSLELDYKYYIRLHERNQNELVFYAVP